MKIFNSVYVKAGLVFLFFFTLFLSAHLMSRGFTSADDPYYHAKHAALIAQSGNLTLVRPWLEFHFFKYAPVDPWWGFHLGQALFIYLFGIVLGVKIFASMLAALVFLVFYLVLFKLKIKHALSWTLLLFAASPIFSFRLLLERPHLLSMIVFPLAIYFLIKNKYFWLFILAMVYALSYHLSPLIILLVFIYTLVDAYRSKQVNLKPFIASAGGILAGIILHPQSLHYLYVSYITIGRVLVLKFSGVDLNIGGELQLLDFKDFISGNLLVILFSIAAAPLFLALKKNGRVSAASDFLFLYSSLWFMASMLVARAVEYWLPAAILFAAAAFNDAAAKEFLQIKKIISQKVNFNIINFFLAGAAIILIFINLANFFGLIYKNKTGEAAKNFKQANLWLEANTKQDSMVFYDNWGIWPMMFYFNDYNHYITGMDPTLLYDYDKQTYWLWRNLADYGLVCGRSDLCLNLSPRWQIRSAPNVIKTIFRSNYAVAGNNPASNLVKTLNSLRGQARLVFKNKDLLIYELL